MLILISNVVAEFLHALLILMRVVFLGAHLKFQKLKRNKEELRFLKTPGVCVL